MNYIYFVRYKNDPVSIANQTTNSFILVDSFSLPSRFPISTLDTASKIATNMNKFKFPCPAPPSPCLPPPRPPWIEPHPHDPSACQACDNVERVRRSLQLPPPPPWLPPSRPPTPRLYRLPRVPTPWMPPLSRPTWEDPPPISHNPLQRVERQPQQQHYRPRPVYQQQPQQQPVRHLQQQQHWQQHPQEPQPQPHHPQQHPQQQGRIIRCLHSAYI